MNNKEQRAAAKNFAQYWKDKGYEKGQSQPFWLSLLGGVLGVESPEQFISFEEQVHLDHTSFIDGYIPSTHVLIEQKGIGKDLNKSIRQSGGRDLTPFEQAQRYASTLPYSERPRWIVVCNFAEFNIYDMEHPCTEPEVLLLKDLPKEYYRLAFLVDCQSEHIQKEIEVSIKAGELVGKMYDKLIEQYKDASNPHSLRSLNMLCVRLVFCLYAEDAGIFCSHNAFHDYLDSFKHDNIRMALISLFDVLNTPYEQRDKYLDDKLAAFPYVNGGLFANNNIEIPALNEEIIDLLLEKASLDFDWSNISPTIFGAVFESTLNPQTRREGGMHYTSIENIHKVIDPLFLDDLKAEFETIKQIKVQKTRNDKLQAFQTKIASLKFLDPACGSGNFLTETYISLRRLENEILRLLVKEGQMSMGGELSPIKVQINQFYGIEINDFAATVAKTALWIAESQMLKETEDIVGLDLDFLPLKTYTNILETDALRVDWNSLVPSNELNYIMGNPPFVGARLMDKTQKESLVNVFGSKYKNVGNLDFVCAWYKKAADILMGGGTRCALVSTNSVCQGESVANLWQPLMESGVVINFAYRTFRWDSEAKIKAHVHCVIVGFSKTKTPKCFITNESGIKQEVKHINAYLIDADDVFVQSRSKQICDVPSIGIGNKPIDGGNYLFTKEEMEAFVQKEPASRQYFKLWYGSEEFINQKPRYCLWLGDCSPKEIQSMPQCLKRVQAVREYRLASVSHGTVKLADKPTRFHVENMPKGNSILIPEVSSAKREYIPMGFISDALCSNLVKLIPNATLFHFGVLTSSVHMAWVRRVCGRLGTGYRYSKDVVYNNFPWVEPTKAQKEKIESTAQEILDARALYPEASLADMYGDNMYLYPELLKAHKENDAAVKELYGFSSKEMSEFECVTKLLKMYVSLTQK
jgi:hypothetical protein